MQEFLLALDSTGDLSLLPSFYCSSQTPRVLLSWFEIGPPIAITLTESRKDHLEQLTV